MNIKKDKKDGSAYLNNKHACLFEGQISSQQFNMIPNKETFMANKVEVSSCKLEADPSFLSLLIKYIKVQSRILLYKFVLEGLKLSYIVHVLWDMTFGVHKNEDEQCYGKIKRGS